VHGVKFINGGLDMEMPGEPIGPMGSFIPSFFDSMPAPPPPNPAAMGAMMDGFFGHLPEEPPPAAMNMSDFGKKEDTKKMPAALKDGTVDEAAVTRAAGRVLYEIVHFGYMDGLSKHEVTAQDITGNAKIIEKTGEEAAVLLKNEGGALPLKAADLDNVVLIGPTALQVDSIGLSGERSVGLPWREVGPWDALKKVTGNANIKDDMTGSTIPASALSHDGKLGLMRSGDAGEQVDATLDFTTKGGNALKPNSTASWKGTLTVPHAGAYWLYLQALGTNANISIDG
jgi:beta-glucosidase